MLNERKRLDEKRLKMCTIDSHSKDMKNTNHTKLNPEVYK